MDFRKPGLDDEIRAAPIDLVALRSVFGKLVRFLADISKWFYRTVLDGMKPDNLQ
jgi:hypothetical protein